MNPPNQEIFLKPQQLASTRKKYFTVNNYKLHPFQWILVTVPSTTGGG